MASLYYRRVICDRLKVYFQKLPPRYQQAQPDIHDKDFKKEVIKKLAKVQKRDYITPESVALLTAFFSVPKEEDNI